MKNISLIVVDEAWYISIDANFSVPIARICGDEQFMNKSSGCEIVAHFIRHQLELDPSIIIAKVDVKNAFNEIAPSAILALGK